MIIASSKSLKAGRLLAILSTALLSATAAQAVTFPDGLTHTIDKGNSFPLEGMTITDGPGATPTSVTVVDGGAIGTFALDGGENLHDRSDERLSRRAHVV